MGATVAIAVMRRKEREVREAFQNAQAVDPLSARSLQEIGLDESRALSRLRRHEIVRESSPGCFYFDDETWMAVRASRFRMAMMIVAAVILVLLVGIYATAANQ
jgi:hypothetical protein